MTEIWYNIEYPSVPIDIKHYEVSNHGNVRRGSIMEKVTQDRNGDATVILVSINDDSVASDSTPPAKYVVADLLRDATSHKIRVFGFGLEDKVFVGSHEREQTEWCTMRRKHHTLKLFHLDWPINTMDGPDPYDAQIPSWTNRSDESVRKTP